MRKEIKYFIGIAIILTSVFTIFSMLFRKYALLVINHFFEICIKVLTNFSASWMHYIGVFVLAMITILVLAFFIRTLFSFIRTKMQIKSLTDFRVVKIPQKVNSICKKINLKQSNLIIIEKTDFHAFSFGFFFPKIVISTGMAKDLSDNELEAVLLHELHHLRNHHSLLFISWGIIASTLFFLPVVSDFVKRMKAVFEHEADQFAIKMQKTPHHLQLALVHTIDSYSSPPGSNPGFAISALETRVNHLTGDYTSNKRLSYRSILFSFLAISIISALLIFPTETHAESESSSGKMTSVHCVENNMHTIGTTNAMTM